MKHFKKIFDLDPNKVQEFVIDLAETNYSEYENKLPKGAYRIEVDWAPWCDEFYAYVNPLYETKDWEHFYLQGKEITLADYMRIKTTHWHFTFPQVYALMTGETVFDEEMTICDDDTDQIKSWVFYYKKEWTEIGLFKSGEYFIVEWDDEKDCEIKKPIPDDLMEVFKKEVDIV